MLERSQGGSSEENPLAAQGGADAVNDTPTVPAHGTEPEEPTTRRVRARVRPARGIGFAGLVLVLILILIVAIYLGALVR